ncbi:FMN-dependent NADH-azoreductase [Paenibacillus sp. GCM10027627]|uniref:FMN-dependent NADH-azoreductase n=1 Tax=unclassified Paenibacillus TaxID=185978 RepID=UPI003634B6E8
MSQVLFIKANDRPSEQSVSAQMYDEFLKGYKEANPEAQLVELNLFAENLPYFDNAMMTGLYKEANGMELTSEEKELTATANRYLDQFMAADKIVIAFPLWNFTIPAQLLTYLFYISQAGKTFKYTEQGPVGLAGGRKVALLNARGGVYSEGPMQQIEMSLNYVKTIMGFIGIHDAETHVIEGHNQFPDRKEAIIGEGLRKAFEAGSAF